MKTFLIGALALVFGLGAPGLAHVGAQEKQRITFTAPAETTKYTQQHVLDVGDVPGHQIRIFEFHRTFPTNAPVFDGVKVVEAWSRNFSDYIDLSGRNSGYTIFVMENGDKIFGRQEGVAHTVSHPDGSRKTSAYTMLTLTGGTGQFHGIRGTLRTTAAADIRAGIAESHYFGEYWMEK